MGGNYLPEHPRLQYSSLHHFIFISMSVLYSLPVIILFPFKGLPSAISNVQRGLPLHNSLNEVGAAVVGAAVVGASVVGAAVVGAAVVGPAVVGAAVVRGAVVGAVVVGAAVV